MQGNIVIHISKKRVVVLSVQFRADQMQGFFAGHRGADLYELVRIRTGRPGGSPRIAANPENSPCSFSGTPAARHKFALRIYSVSRPLQESEWGGTRQRAIRESPLQG
jgi:hypothetical protein